MRHDRPKTDRCLQRSTGWVTSRSAGDARDQRAPIRHLVLPPRRRELAPELVPAATIRKGIEVKTTKCIFCQESTKATAAIGQLGNVTGPLCDDCEFWCDGNIISTAEATA